MDVPVRKVLKIHKYKSFMRNDNCFSSCVALLLTCLMTAGTWTRELLTKQVPARAFRHTCDQSFSEGPLAQGVVPIQSLLSSKSLGSFQKDCSPDSQSEEFLSCKWTGFYSTKLPDVLMVWITVMWKRPTFTLSNYLFAKVCLTAELSAVKLSRCITGE